MNVLVIPTNRPDSLAKFLDAWRPWPWDKIVIVEDAPEVSRGVASDQVLQFSWKDIDATLAEPGIISRCDSGIRTFGFWKAWSLGADFIFTLDDDCFPVGDDYVRQHLHNLEGTPAWHSSVRHLRVRGLPYVNVGKLGDVYVSMGLWVGHPDIDAVQALAHRSRPPDPGLDAEISSWLMPSGQYFPLCGMNLAFRREATCLMYYPPMGLGSPYSRFDDIWSGLVLQRICRHLRYGIVCGRPVVEHRRASDPFGNLVKEAPGIRANEDMWEIVDAVELHGGDPLTCMREMGSALGSHSSPDPYVRRWGEAMLEWCTLFEAGPEVEQDG